MFGLMTKAEHERLMAGMKAEIKRWVDELNEAYREAREMRDKVSSLMMDNGSLQAQIISSVNTISILRAERAANARYVEVGKARLATLERAKAKREGVS